jgi:hypothetical protein
MLLVRGTLRLIALAISLVLICLFSASWVMTVKATGTRHSRDCR